MPQNDDTVLLKLNSPLKFTTKSQLENFAEFGGHLLYTMSTQLQNIWNSKHSLFMSTQKIPWSMVKTMGWQKCVIVGIFDIS